MEQRRQSSASRLPPRKRRHPRAARACQRCREKKYRCDELSPCSHCKKSQVDCVYQGNRQRENLRDSNYVTDLESKVIDLTAKLRGSEAVTGHAPHLRQGVTPGHHSEVQPTLSPSPQDGFTPRDEIPVFNETSELPADGDDEIREVNQHTNAIEFHGSTSSAAFIGHLQRASEPRRPEGLFSPRMNHTSHSLVSTLHNSNFSPSCTAVPGDSGLPRDQNYYVEHAHTFISGYFENIHFVHPFIDKVDFMSRSRDLWLNRGPQPELTFVALYLSVLSFGALVRVWDEGRLDGLTRFEWSRKLFGEAQRYLNHLQFSNDLETVQCLYLMAKICQNELNPNMAYMYLGLAIRTCLSAGFNREDYRPNDYLSDRISKTWWGLFSLEIEMSLSVGRPDTLGMDKYHNRAIPERDDSEYAIIPWMVDFAQIIRRVSVQIYHSRVTFHEKLQRALQIENEMDSWLEELPDRIKPDIWGRKTSGSALCDPKWARRQRLVLGIRYCNVKTLLFRPFLRSHIHNLGNGPLEQGQPASKCLDSAKKTIEVIYNTYCVHTFFRCWWYNTTYVMFATATLLLPLSKLGMSSETTPPLLRYIEMAVEILEAMDESVVARKSVEIIKHYLRLFRASDTQGEVGIDNDNIGNGEIAPMATDIGPGLPGDEMPEWAYGFMFPDYSFDGIARLFDELGGLPGIGA